MRLKEDSSSWNASKLKRKLKEIPGTPVWMRKKDTRKWCKGVVGREHDYEYQIPKNDALTFRMVPVCTQCGRQDYHDVLYWCRHHEDWEQTPGWNHDKV